MPEQVPPGAPTRRVLPLLLLTQPHLCRPVVAAVDVARKARHLRAEVVEAQARSPTQILSRTTTS